MTARKFACVKQMEEITKEIALIDKGLYNYNHVDLEKITKQYRAINYQNMLKILSNKAKLQIEEAKFSKAHLSKISEIKLQYSKYTVENRNTEQYVNQSVIDFDEDQLLYLK